MNITDVWKMNWKAFGSERCSIYVVAPEGTWPVKIGIAVYPISRVRDLQTSHWKKLEVVGAVWCHNKQDALNVERKTHAMLEDDNRRLLGEWFDRSAEQAIQAINFASDLTGIEVHDTLPKDAYHFMELRNRANDLNEQCARDDIIRKSIHHNA